MRLLIEYALAENKRKSRWERLLGIEIFTILRLKVRAIIVNSHFEVLWLNQRGV